MRTLILLAGAVAMATNSVAMCCCASGSKEAEHQATKPAGQSHSHGAPHQHQHDDGAPADQGCPGHSPADGSPCSCDCGPDVAAIPPDWTADQPELPQGVTLALTPLVAGIRSEQIQFAIAGASARGSPPRSDVPLFISNASLLI